MSRTALDRYEVTSLATVEPYKAKDRGLCDCCSQYDWAFLLTPDESLVPRGLDISNVGNLTKHSLERRSRATGEIFEVRPKNDRSGYTSRVSLLARGPPYPGRYEVYSILKNDINVSIYPKNVQGTAYSGDRCVLCGIFTAALKRISYPQNRK